MTRQDKPDHLESWKAIAAHLNRDLRTVQRWERTRGLPVHRLPGGGRGAVYANMAELEEWRRQSGFVVHTEVSENVWEGVLYRWGALAGCLALALMVALALTFRGAPPATQPLRIVPLTALPGDERWPVFSPDGRRVAFGWRKEGSGAYELYVVDIGNSAPLRIAGELNSAPAWSHDGLRIAFHRSVPGTRRLAIVVVPASGGVERVSGDVSQNSAGRIWPQLAWSGDDRALISADRDDPESPFHLVAISAVDGTKRALTRPPAGSRGDQAPVVSPDGSKLAFLRLASITVRDLWLLRLSRNQASGEPWRATFENCCVLNPMWAPSGAELRFTSNRAGGSALFRLGIQGIRRGTPVVVTPLQNASNLSSARAGGRIVFTTSVYDEELWRLDLQPSAIPVRLIASTASEHMPAISPDGSAIAYSSNQTGRFEIWTSAADGSAPVRLTHAREYEALTPRWSPDGKRIAFECGDGICVAPASGGPVAPVSRKAAGDVSPSWSRDGRWLYFGSGRTGRFQIWKVAMTAEGTRGAPVPVTRQGGYSGVESFDGKTFYYGKTEQGGEIWSVPVEGGPEAPVPAAMRYVQRPENFAAVRGGIYSIADSAEDGMFELLYWKYGSTTVDCVAKLRGTPGTGLSVAPDGSYVVYSAIETRRGDLMLFENVQ